MSVRYGSIRHVWSLHSYPNYTEFYKILGKQYPYLGHTCKQNWRMRFQLILVVCVSTFTQKSQEVGEASNVFPGQVHAKYSIFLHRDANSQCSDCNTVHVSQMVPFDTNRYKIVCHMSNTYCHLLVLWGQT